jgi:hypothetical protein
VFEKGLADKQNGNSGDSTRDRRENISKRLVEIAKKNNLSVDVCGDNCVVSYYSAGRH